MVGTGIGATNGVFTWTPSDLQGPTTNSLSIIVRDSGSPPLSATQTFVVIVRDTISDVALSIGSTNVLAGETNLVPVLWFRCWNLPMRQLIFMDDSRVEIMAVIPASSELVSLGFGSVSSNRHSLAFVLDPEPVSARTHSGLAEIPRVEQ